MILEIGETVRIGPVTIRVLLVHGNNVQLEISASSDMSVRIGCGKDAPGAH